MEPLNRALNRHQFIPRCPLRTCTFTHTTIHERERERLPRTTAHAHLSRYTCPRFGLLSLSLSDLTDLLANRMPFTVFTSVPISVYSLVGYRIRCDFYVHGKYQLVSCRSLFITEICDRACNVVRYFSLSPENF